MPQFVRLESRARVEIELQVDGATVKAFAGDTVLTAILTHRRFVRLSEFGDGPRAGYCLMGACQDCWIWLAGRRRARACTTLAEAGMDVRSTAPPEHDGR